jgi:hypothetical protein
VGVGPATLIELRSSRVPRPWLFDLVLPEINGGKLAISHLDHVRVPPTATALQVSGLNQASFEHLVERLGPQFSAIEFWKCPRVTDLSPLEDLSQLRLVSFYWNQKATRLWNMSRTPELAGLHFDDFNHLHDLGDLATASSLRELEFGDAVWDTAVFDSLEPLSALTGLTSLKLSAKKIVDGRVNPWRRSHSWNP